ncbi:hypothetical protein [Fructilactobacillus florum]|uniref:hypothetical protein n=1 Tax=Fructilactobacillus florum TaxID=640331 RepID=UPI0006D0471C
MNLIYRNYADSNKTATNLLLEAPTGSGKTLGYLLPMAYLAQKKSASCHQYAYDLVATTVAASK